MKKLYRSQKNRMIAGLCGGVGEVYSIDPTLLRLACVFICLVSGIFPLLITYLIAWIAIPLSVKSWGIIRRLNFLNHPFLGLLRKETFYKRVEVDSFIHIISPPYPSYYSYSLFIFFFELTRKNIALIYFYAPAIEMKWKRWHIESSLKTIKLWAVTMPTHWILSTLGYIHILIAGRALFQKK